jgi:hypothetical protein
MNGFRKAATVVAATTMAVGLAGCEPPETWWPTVLEVNAPAGNPVVGDFNEDGLEDVYWYAAGSEAEEMWTARPEGGFDRAPAPAVTGRYRAVAGDFDGDDDDDVLWVGSNGRPSALWTFEGGAVASKRPARIGRSVNEHVVVIERASGPDHVGLVVGTNATREPGLWIWDPLNDDLADARHVDGSTDPRPLAGDFDGDGHGDVLLYGYGSAPDSIGWGRADGEYDTQVITIHGRYLEARALDADGDGLHDIAFFPDRQVTAASIPVWKGQPGRWFAKANVGAPTVEGDTYVQEDRGDGRDNVIIRVEDSDDQVWELGADGAAIVHTITDFDGGVPLLGQFSAADRDDMFLWSSRLLLSPQG